MSIPALATYAPHPKRRRAIRAVHADASAPKAVEAVTILPSTPLVEAQRIAERLHWEGRRSHRGFVIQSSIAIADLSAYGVRTVGEATREIVLSVVKAWRNAGLAASSCRVRLATLSRMGVATKGTRPTVPRRLKWWLNPRDQERLTTWLRRIEPEGRYYGLMSDYLDWTCHTGLRVEETLRLTWGHVQFGQDEDGRDCPEGASMTVPGLKTNGSQATLPLSVDAAALLLRRRDALPEAPRTADPVFPIGYQTLRAVWQECRVYLGVHDDPLATLKALRRTAANTLHNCKGMPLQMTQQYLRHSNVQTTMGYLALAGGTNANLMREYLR